MAKRGRVRVVEDDERKCGTCEKVLAIIALVFLNILFFIPVVWTLSDIQDLHRKNDTNHLRL